MPKPKVFLICTGVGHINRGYESFTLECFENLKTSNKFELFLLKGGGSNQHHHLKIACIKRNSALGTFINKVTGKEKYWVEQLTFLFGMLPALLKYKPSVIYYSDFVLGTFLWQLRRFFGFKYQLLFSNGAPNGPPFTRMDHLQQLLPMYVKEAELAGTPSAKQTLLPYAITINKEKNRALIADKANLMQKLKLPTNKKIIICVGAVNCHHKRIDYLINEFTLMQNDNYFLVVLGQIDEQSTSIILQAKQQLPNNNYLIQQVAGNDVVNYLAVADYFILPSLNEGLPRVLPEALAAGLLPIVHNYTVTQETLKGYGVFKNMTATGILQDAIDEVDARNIGKQTLIDFAFNNYSWDKLVAKYEDMMVKNIYK